MGDPLLVSVDGVTLDRLAKVARHRGVSDAEQITHVLRKFAHGIRDLVDDEDRLGRSVESVETVGEPPQPA
jgi:hypothetical protein